jgi:glycosyltransferase involved in cell wall biosynthesis
VIIKEQIQPSIRSLFKSIKHIRDWRRLFLNEHIDWVHTADPFCTRVLLTSAWLAKVKILCHFHFPFTDSVLDWITKYQPDPTCAVFCSEELQRSTGQRLAKFSPSISQYVVHNGVDIYTFSPNALPNNSVKRIGIVANLQERKGHDDFLHMAKIIKEQGYLVIFDIIGGDILDTPRQPYLEALAAELALTDDVIFHGQVSDVKALVSNLDVYVCASHQEAFPVSILEAMALQKAIVATDVNGIPEALEHEVHGLLVPKQSPAALAAAVIRLLDDEILAAQYAKDARHRVEVNFSLDTYVNHFREIYS